MSVSADTETTRTTSSWLAICAAVPVLTALFIDLAFGRWGAYLKSPIPGVFLPDFLLAVSCLLALPNLRRLKNLPTPVLVTSALCLVYAALRLGLEIFVFQNNDQYLALRDLAPFLFLGLVPIVAMALQEITWPIILRIIRAATVTYLIITLLASWNLISPFSSLLIGSENIRIFENRGDLAGVLLGIGLLAWGDWKQSLQPNRWVQLVLIGAGFQLDSRSALITFAFFLLTTVLLERSKLTWKKALKWTLASAIVIVVVSSIQALSSVEDLPPVGSESIQDQNTPQSQKGPQKSPQDHSLIPNPLSNFTDIGGQGTLGARLDTYSKVTNYLLSGHVWILGSGPGSDALYEACTGVKSPAPAKTLISTGEGILALPKCAVDDQNAPSTLRDPHNWLLNLLLYNGLLGFIIFILPFLMLSRRNYGKGRAVTFTRIVIMGFFVCGSFGVIISSPFAMLPIAVLMAGALRHHQETRLTS